ncbi:MAG TPA: hypothetical protein PLU22_11785 [Polyangiaceae bacterium]|nr:hypothetical protein [Polyangiaceae bacterium]
MELARLKRLLLALPDHEYRRGWLHSELVRMGFEQAATVLDELCEESERGEPSAREVLLSVAMVFAALGESELVAHLREEAAARHLLSLDRLLRHVPRRDDADDEPDPTLVPDYHAGRELTLGERRSLARRPSRRAFDALLRDPHPLVIRQLLGNPALTEDDVVRLVSRRPARVAVLQEVASRSRWLCRPRVRLALLLNPGSPSTIVMPLLGLCTRPELRRVAQATHVSPVLRATALELLGFRPPLDEPDPEGVELQ